MSAPEPRPRDRSSLARWYAVESPWIPAPTTTKRDCEGVLIVIASRAIALPNTLPLGPGIRARGDRVQLGGREAREPERLEPRRPPLAEVDGGEAPEREQLEAVVRVEDRVDVRTHEVGAGVGVGGEGALGPVRVAPPLGRAALEAVERRGE